MDTPSRAVIRSLSGIVGIVVVGFLLWHDGSLGSFVNGSFARPPQNLEDACNAAKGMASITPDGSANGKFTKFLRVDADCDRKTLTLVFTVSGDSRLLSEADWQTIATSVSQQACAGEKYRQLAAYGWTARESFSFSDQVRRSATASSCS